jgi:Ser/Thr protein kinase RdoA (MazF antagonist)
MLQQTATELLAKKPDGPQWDMYADALSGLHLSTLKSETLLHYDLHAGNFLVTDKTACILDWSFACRGAAWIDAALLVPRFIAAGHTPAQAEELISGLPAWSTAPPASVTGLGALWTMFREFKALYGPHNDRAFRQQAAQAGRAWLTHRTR